jgi:hypothetical protein
MPTAQIVALLIAERDRLNRAIEALEGPARRRGRPPKNSLDVVAEMPPKRKRRGRTAAQRKAQSEKMKKYWAQRRKQEKS